MSGRRNWTLATWAHNRDIADRDFYRKPHADPDRQPAGDNYAWHRPKNPKPPPLGPRRKRPAVTLPVVAAMAKEEP